jgi:hypothetical protein
MKTNYKWDNNIRILDKPYYMPFPKRMPDIKINERVNK